MELKKILALAMLAILALPSLTMVVKAKGNGEEVGLAGAIERAQTYLDRVRTSAEKLASEYSKEHMIQGYLDEINDLLGRYEGEEPEILFELKTYESATAELSDVEAHRGNYSVHLETTGTPGPHGIGDEARIVIPMPEGFTLGDLKKISWSVKTKTGYPPHVDIIIEDDIDGVSNIDSLTAELACNVVSYTPPPTGFTYDSWLETFEGFTDGPDSIDSSTILWVTRIGSGTVNAPYGTLAELKDGNVTYPSGYTDPLVTINKDVVVLRLEIEVDNWIAQTEAYVDDIKIKGPKLKGFTYDFEDEPKEYGDLGAEAFLEQASEYLDEGDTRSAARCLASARNILGRVKGLLNSMAKAHKVAREEKFRRQVEHRLERIEDKIDRLRGRGRGKGPQK